jgi:hypothetical protein
VPRAPELHKERGEDRVTHFKRTAPVDRRVRAFFLGILSIILASPSVVLAQEVDGPPTTEEVVVDEGSWSPTRDEAMEEPVARTSLPPEDSAPNDDATPDGTSSRDGDTFEGHRQTLAEVRARLALLVRDALLTTAEQDDLEADLTEASQAAQVYSQATSPAEKSKALATLTSALGTAEARIAKIEAAPERLRRVRERLDRARAHLDHASTQPASRDAVDRLRGTASVLARRLQKLEEAAPATVSDAELVVLAGDVSAFAHAAEALKQEEGGSDLVQVLLAGRCKVAICFDNGNRENWLGIEPLLELPVGKSFSLGGTSLADYVNNNDIRIDLAAGIRLWAFQDWVSLSVYISKPLTDAPVRIAGSSFVYPGKSIRRPYPGVALGLLFDSLWIGFDRDELRNGGAGDNSVFNPEYPPNTVVSSSWTLTLALLPVTAFRSAIGSATEAVGGKK